MQMRNVVLVAGFSSMMLLGCATPPAQVFEKVEGEEFIQDRFASVTKTKSELGGAAVYKGDKTHSLVVKRKPLDGFSEVDLSGR